MTARVRFSLARAYRHLRAVDPRLGALIEASGPFTPRPGDDPYGRLVRTILFQQLAGPAARAIQRRWLTLYGDGAATPAPRAILATSDEQFRSAGVSRQKAAYLRDLAAQVLDGRLDLEALGAAPDEAVTRALTVVHGLGEWSAHIFLLLELGRPDVLPAGDLGVRRGMQIVYGLAKPPTPAQARGIGAPWAPYRSVGSWYMWRAVDTVETAAPA
ncbi:MAG: DNA-3-methyladenine glycosylase 2 family protein [Dehalococcoidia bacterium]|nr:DNA-3-methyladenine glycosylase 2 family protein [Dehalococcoidia bacterium]